ncbi:hypothetical protein FVE85_3632 [Porphyridium purpureum]|uniref:Uncharacterized protein n=1 Tax=Porphyridium purpureum TaxID=35688 RepID=A0A5J4YNB0_PORPP|nr:hypothetical protein FVE85_3632 [Porphyridium purpureum]|eukprot:POR4844..scf249_10
MRTWSSAACHSDHRPSQGTCHIRNSRIQAATFLSGIGYRVPVTGYWGEPSDAPLQIYTRLTMQRFGYSAIRLFGYSAIRLFGYSAIRSQGGSVWMCVKVQ